MPPKMIYVIFLFILFTGFQIHAKEKPRIAVLSFHEITCMVPQLGTFVWTTQAKYKDEDIWQWQGAASVQLRIIDKATARIVYSGTESAYALSETIYGSALKGRGQNQSRGGNGCI
jgi:hypothetical protein